MSNPLLGMSFRIPFDQIRAEHVEPAVQTLLAAARARLEEVAAEPGPRTYENTLGALDRMTEPLDQAMSVVRHLEAVATYPELRAAYNAVQPEVSAFYSSIPLHAGLWHAVKTFRETDEARTLQGTEARFLTKTVESFRRHGAELDAAGKKRMEEIDVELTKLTTRFSEHVLDSTNAFELYIDDEACLAGLPPTAVAAARQSAEEKGKPGWRFTLQGPSYLALMTYLDDQTIREQVYRAYSTRATQGEHDNTGIILQILELRKEKSRLLGYRDFADFVLEDRMAHSGEQAQRFLADLKEKTRAQFERENKDLAAFAGKPQLEPWDIAYYSEKQRQALYDFDEEALRPYFPLQQVVAGMFEIFGRLFGIRVIEEEAPKWHPQTQYYSIYDEDGTWRGSFYADWFPRETKRGGAWMDVLVTGDGNPDAPHLGLICGNMSPPVGGKPALLTHREVETVFHEFGHLLHHCLSRVPVRSLAGTSVPWDFVELPSQIMENWCWERPALDLFARHHETGEPIPADLFAKMKRARTFRAANAQMRQLGFGMVDLAMHREYDPARDGDVLSYARRILQEYSPAPLPEDYGMIAGFTHLFASPVGYGAGYYSYKWAEVLEADAFTRFRENGVFDGEVGRAYRNEILARGNSDDPAQLYRNFMGRDPDPDALLERLGLVS